MVGGNAASDDEMQVENADTRWTCSIELSDADTAGAVSFTIDGADAAGNALVQVTETTDSSSMAVDRTAPTLSAVSISSSTWRRSSGAESFSSAKLNLPFTSSCSCTCKQTQDER